ncbi:MAG: NAD(+) synthase [Candidatus Gracilibacteria bacterium]|nr:NAD(+) synthase [Candidatus Gracilibacteria bacterium]
MTLTPDKNTIIIANASKALAEYCIKYGIHNTVTGVSGGLDSAVTIFLSQKAKEVAAEKGFELRSLGLILPCHSDPKHAVLGKKVIKACGAELLEVDLTGVFDFTEKAVLKPVADAVAEYHNGAQKERYRTSQGNVKARLRMGLGTYYVANMVNGLVLSTDNYSELMMGFWTLHGDVGDYGMIQNLWKGSELIEIARELEVPQEVIDSAPTDGLGVLPGGDEAQLGAPYPVVDEILKELVQNGYDLDGPIEQLKQLGSNQRHEASNSDLDSEAIHYSETWSHPLQLVQKIAKRAFGNAFKRKSPVNLSREELGL